MDTLQKTLKALPHSPGVYVYKDEFSSVLYVGKARDLSKRVRQYFVNPKNLPEKTRQLVPQIRSIRVIRVSTEFEALLLEAKLIRRFYPKYNSIAKDDKSPIYIHIHRFDELPSVTLSRKPKNESVNSSDYFGPFSSVRTARDILKTLRRSVPFCQQKVRNGRPCFYTHLGLCNPCPSEISKMPDGEKKNNLTALNKTNMRRLAWVLSGHSNKTIRSMQTQMHTYARHHKFEEATALRDRITRLLATINNRYDPFHFEETDKLEKAPGEQQQSLLQLLQSFFPAITACQRIECYDISSLQGGLSGGSMVVFLDGIPHTDHYRRFKIRETSKLSDVAMMEEVLKRRFSHAEWPYPDLILVDGGKAQVGRISSLLQSQSIGIPVIGLTKRFERIVIQTHAKAFQTVTIPLSNPALQLLQHLRDEAHRFAVAYHRNLRNRAFAQIRVSLI